MTPPSPFALAMSESLARLGRQILGIRSPSPRPVGNLRRIPNPTPALNLAIPWEPPTIRTVQPNCTHLWAPCDPGCPNYRKDPTMPTTHNHDTSMDCYRGCPVYDDGIQAEPDEYDWQQGDPQDAPGPLDPTVLEPDGVKVGTSEQGVKAPGFMEQVIRERMAYPSLSVGLPSREHLTSLEVETPDGLRIRVEVTQPEDTTADQVRQAVNAVYAGVRAVQTGLAELPLF